MRLVRAAVGPYKSINVQQDVSIDPEVTVLVGMNEAGKTVFLEGLVKSRDVMGAAKFNPVDDYPRKDLPGYLKVHDAKPATATKLTFQPTAEQITMLRESYHAVVGDDFTFELGYNYKNELSILRFDAPDERAALAHLAVDPRLQTDARAALSAARSIRTAAEGLATLSLTDAEKGFLTELHARIKKAGQWASVLEHELWDELRTEIPKFAYFGEYELLPSKLNLRDLQARVAANDPKRLESEHRAVLALLRMAGVGFDELHQPGGYETLRSKLEGLSISLTDQIMQFWKANESDLEVFVDVKEDSSETQPPFNAGPNLYLRIKNLRHRGVSTPFTQRSRGFVWFFSFLVWFDSVKEQLALEGKKHEDNVILLLDEPAMSLHGLAQRDFLKYVDSLAERHQVIYTTHSPFMVHTDRIERVRVVEDIVPSGTTITSNVGGSGQRALFPLQAALGYTIAQNLFISERNLVVEGPSELLYLTAISTILEAAAHTGLRSDVTIVPAGGLDKVVTFVALLNASGLKLSVLHDYNGKPDQKLMDLVKQKLISGKAILNPSQFRDLKKLGQDTDPSDIEDLLPVDMYLAYFNQAFAKQLGTDVAKDVDLPQRPRVVQRLEAWLEAKQIHLRPSGGFNHYTVAAAFAAKPPKNLNNETRDRFVALFKAINALYS